MTLRAEERKAGYLGRVREGGGGVCQCMYMYHIPMERTAQTPQPMLCECVCVDRVQRKAKCAPFQESLHVFNGGDVGVLFALFLIVCRPTARGREGGG